MVSSIKKLSLFLSAFFSILIVTLIMSFNVKADDPVEVKWVDGAWRSVVNGEVDADYTGLASNEYGWWYCENGIVTFNAEGIYSNENGDWYVWGSQVQFGCNGVFFLKNHGTYGWWLIRDGHVSYEDTVASNGHGWWKITNGRIDFNFTGLAQNEWGWWYCRNGGVRFNVEGIISNEWGDWYVSGGQVQLGCYDIRYVDNNGDAGWWLIKGGQIAYEDTVASNVNGWWKVSSGKVDFSFTGAASNEYGTWYIENGMVQFITGRRTFVLNGETVTRYIMGGLVMDGDIDKAVLDAANNILNNSCGRDLYAAYRWCVDNITYTSEAHGYTTIASAMYSFETGYGDCIGFASTFCWLARALGYECNVLYGEVPYASGGLGDHAWCEIIVDGTYYWVDTQYVHQTGDNLYLFNYGQSGTWMYSSWSVMSDF